MEILFEDEYFHIYLDSKNNVIEFGWHKFAYDDVFRDRLEKVYAFTLKYKCTKIINDMSKMAAIPQETLPYLELDWLPRMVKGGVTAWANITPSSAITKMVTNRFGKGTAVDEVRTEAGFRENFFDDLEKGRQWIESLP